MHFNVIRRAFEGKIYLSRHDFFYLKDDHHLLIANGMWQSDLNVEKTSLLSGIELKRLLVLLSQTPNICFRFRQVGEMWMQNHMKVSSVNENNVLFYDDKDSKFYHIRINSIMQFDIDNRIHHYQPHFHYSVQPSSELE